MNSEERKQEAREKIREIAEELALPPLETVILIQTACASLSIMKGIAHEEYKYILEQMATAYKKTEEDFKELKEKNK